MRHIPDSIESPITHEIRDYVEERIIPLYDKFDKAHRRDHVRMVISQSMDLAVRLEHYPELDKEGHYERMVQHLREKYGRGGYLHLWFDHSPNAERLEALRRSMDDERALRKKFEEYYGQENSEP